MSNDIMQIKIFKSINYGMAQYALKKIPESLSEKTGEVENFFLLVRLVEGLWLSSVTRSLVCRLRNS